MKKIVVSFLFIFLFSFNLTPIQAISTNTDKPELKIVTKTDKDSYKKGDPICYQIIVTNNTNYDGKNLVVSIELPSSVTTKHGKTLSFEKEHILSHQSYTFDIVGTVVDDLGNTGITVESTNDSLNSNVTNNVGTSDLTNIYGYVFLISISGIVIFFYFKDKKKIIKVIKILLIFSTSVTCISILANDIYAEEKTYLNVSKSSIYTTNIENKEYNLVIKTLVDFYSKGDGKITLNQTLDQNNVYTSTSEKIELSGTASDPDGIKEVRYTINDTKNDIKSENATGTEKWTINENLEPGYYYITIIGIDNLGNECNFDIKLNVLNSKIELNDSVYILSESQHNDGFVDSILEEDGITLIYENSSYIVKKYNEGLLQIGNTLYFEPCNNFLTGYSATVKEICNANTIILPQGYVYPTNISNYLTNYTAIQLTEASIDAITPSNVSTSYNEETQLEPLFILTPDGKNLLDDQSDQIKKQKANEKTSNKSISIDYFDSSEVSINFLNLKLYEHSDGSANDKISLSGNIKLSNLSLSGGFFKASDNDLLNSLGISLNGKLTSSLKLEGNLEINTDNIVEKINTYLSQKSEKFENKSINGFSGIDYSNEIRLATVGINIGKSITISGNNLDRIAYQSKTSPIVIISLTMGLDGKIQAKFSLERKQDASTTASLYVKLKELKDFIKPRFSLDSINSNSNLYDIKSKITLKDKTYTPVTIKGEINSELEISPIGYDVKLFYMGISPAHIGMQVKSKIQANFEGTLQREAKNKWSADFKGSAKGNTSVFSIGEIALKVKNHPIIPDGLGINAKLNERVFLIDSFNISTIDSTGSIFNSKTKEKINLSNHRILLELDKDNVYQADVKNGSFIFSKIPSGDYTVYLQEKNTQKNIYEGQVKITYIKPNFDLYIDYKEETPPSNQAITIGEGKTLRLYGTSGGKIYYNSLEGTTIDRAWYDTRSNFNGVNAKAYANEDYNGTSGWISLDNNEFTDITVIKGELTIQKETFDSGITSEVKDGKALIKYELNPGESIDFEDKVGIGYTTYRPIFINTKDGSAHVSHFKGAVLGTEERDYTMSADITKINLTGYDNTAKITCTSGKIIVYIRADEIDKLK